ncbi:hypothetical protein RN001_012663 [Aquatica leii]|uniref:Uncharacterized protein n=1 Tax=Aquatica leii TaxID=1421715 RepID=A0AAN7S7V8_9COLE|nr:hypothetical protein RN001_012663 [Aquatica leii]
MTPLIAPTISEVKAELGTNLADMFFKTCAESIKPLLGLTPLLSGPTGELWMSPSDVLIGKVCLKPPLTGKYMKALTHQGVLLIGGDIEKKVMNEAEMAKQKALKDQEETILFSAEAKCKKAIEIAVKNEQAKCSEEKDAIRKECLAKLQNDLLQLERKLKNDFEQTLRRVKRDLNEHWQDQLIAAVNETVTKLTKKFLKELSQQEEELYKKFNVELKKEKLKHQFDLQEVRKSCQESFGQLKHQLECKNIANIMYILCAERRKCRSERKHMEDSYQKRIENLQNALVDRDIDIIKLKADTDEKVKEIQMREECLREILCQYQKFINFALRSCPTQAEFLLDVEKLMLFELTQNVARTKSKHGKQLGKDVIPWKTDTVSIKAPVNENQLTAKDYHRCDNEIDTPISDISMKSTDYIPALHYNKHMYVREDFRNMMSRGLQISPSNLIWNKDVDHLMQILKRSGEDTIESESEESPQSEQLIDTAPAENDQCLDTKIRFEHPPNVNSKDIICPLYDPPSKTLITDTQFCLQELSTVQHQKSDTSMFELIKPCCTRCTQTYIKPQYFKNSSFEDDHESDINFSYPKDSLIKYRMSLKQLKAVKEQEEDIQLSRLSLARDSFIVHRHSLVVKRQHRNSECANTTGDKTGGESSGESKLKHKKVVHKITPTLSKLSLSKDSLELLRSQSMISKRKVESKESIEIQDGIVGAHYGGETDSRVVKVSHIEMIPLDEKPKKPKVCTTSFDSGLIAADSPWLTYAYKAKPVENLDKLKVVQQPDVVKVVGDKKLKTHTETQQDFALHRAASMLGIFHKHPSLMKLFTPCTK